MLFCNLLLFPVMWWTSFQVNKLKSILFLWLVLCIWHLFPPLLSIYAPSFKKSIFADKMFSSVQLLIASNSANPLTAAHQASLSITNSRSLHKLSVHRVGDAIQSSLPLSSPSSPAFSLSQHHGLLHWISSLHWVAKVLDLQH